MIARAVWEGWSLRGGFGVGSFAYLIGLALSPGERSQGGLKAMMWRFIVYLQFRAGNEVFQE